MGKNVKKGGKTITFKLNCAVKSKKEEPGCDSSYYSSGCSWSEFKRNRWHKAAIRYSKPRWVRVCCFPIYQKEMGLNILLRKGLVCVLFGWVQTDGFGEKAVSKGNRCHRDVSMRSVTYYVSFIKSSTRLHVQVLGLRRMSALFRLVIICTSQCWI